MKLNLNLARRPYVHRRALFASYGVVLGVLILVLAINLSYYFRLDQATSRLEQRMAEIREKQEAVPDTGAVSVSEAELKSLAGEVSFANDILDRDAFRWTELLGHLEETLPDGITITSLTPDFKRREVELSGLARNVARMSAFLDRLLASDSFADTYLLSQDKRKVKDGEGRERDAVVFSIVLKGAF